MNIIAAPYEAGPSAAISEIDTVFLGGAREWEYCLGFEGETWDALMVDRAGGGNNFCRLPGLK